MVVFYLAGRVFGPCVFWLSNNHGVQLLLLNSTVFSVVAVSFRLLSPDCGSDVIFKFFLLLLAPQTHLLSDPELLGFQSPSLHLVSFLSVVVTAFAAFTPDVTSSPPGFWSQDGSGFPGLILELFWWKRQNGGRRWPQIPD